MTYKVAPGTFQSRGGIISIVGGFLLAALFGVLDAREIDVPFALRFIPPVMIFGGTFLYWRGRQYGTKANAETILGDTKPDVLYLRTFDTDSSVLRYVRWSFLLPRMISGIVTEEEQLRDVLQPFGDLVAIGRPGEKLPTPGAARLYVSDPQWHSVVSDQMRSATLVIIRAGHSTGLLWELKQAFETLDPTRLLVLVLNMKAKAYAVFRDEASKIFGVAFPAANEFRTFGRVSGFVRFSSDWTLNVLRLHAPFLRRTVYRPYQPLFQYTLKPIFTDFRLAWQMPPVSILSLVVKMVYAAFAVLTGLFVIDNLFALHWFDDT